MTYTVPIPTNIPEGTSPYIAEAIRERRRIKVLQTQAGVDHKTAEIRHLAMQILSEQDPTLEFRDGIPYHPPPTAEELEVRRERKLQIRAMRVYRQSIKVRMKRLGRSGAEIENLTRQEIIDRDQSICYLCGKTCEPQEIHLDHVIPISRGGAHTRKNLRVACANCNLDKNDLTEDEYRAVIRMRYPDRVRAG